MEACSHVDKQTDTISSKWKQASWSKLPASQSHRAKTTKLDHLTPVGHTNDHQLPPEVPRSSIFLHQLASRNFPICRLLSMTSESTDVDEQSIFS